MYLQRISFHQVHWSLLTACHSTREPLGHQEATHLSLPCWRCLHTVTAPATQLCQLIASHPAHNHHTSRCPPWPPTSSRGDKGTDGRSMAAKGGNGLLWHKWLSPFCSKHHTNHLAARAFTAGLDRQFLWGDGCTSGSLAQWQLPRPLGRLMQWEGHSAPERLFQPRVTRLGMKTGGSISWCRWDSDMPLYVSWKKDLSDPV